MSILMFFYCILIGIFPKAVIGIPTFQTHSKSYLFQVSPKTKSSYPLLVLKKTFIFNFDSMKVNYKMVNLLKDPFILRSAIQQTFYGAITVCPAL